MIIPWEVIVVVWHSINYPRYSEVRITHSTWYPLHPRTVTFWRKKHNNHDDRILRLIFSPFDYKNGSKVVHNGVIFCQKEAQSFGVKPQMCHATVYPIANHSRSLVWGLGCILLHVRYNAKCLSQSKLLRCTIIILYEGKEFAQNLIYFKPVTISTTLLYYYTDMKKKILLQN